MDNSIEIKRLILAAQMQKGNEPPRPLEDLTYPLLASPKLDGIRCLIHPTKGPVTRKLKPIPNVYIRTLLAKHCPKGFDGEILTYNDKELHSFNQVQSAVMSHTGEPKFMFMVFDTCITPNMPFIERLNQVLMELNETPGGGLIEFDRACIKFVQHTQIEDADTLRYVNRAFLDEGFEGTMMRSMDGPYKQGRSTFNQGYLIKLKEFFDAEGTVIDFEELMHNNNEQTKDELGYAKRSSHKDNLVPGDTLGALIVDTRWGELKLGTGFDAALRQEIWNTREQCRGKLVTFKYQPYGMQDLPRFPVFLGFRRDL